MIQTNESDSVSYAPHKAYMCTLDTMSGVSMMSVYCNCGRIVVLDRSEMRIRLQLGKELECTGCRNARISQEIDSMNDHFNGVEEIDGISY